MNGVRLWLGHHGLAKDFAKEVVATTAVLQSRRRSTAGATAVEGEESALLQGRVEGRLLPTECSRREMLAYLVQIGAGGFPELFVSAGVACLGPAFRTFIR